MDSLHTHRRLSHQASSFYKAAWCGSAHFNQNVFLPLRASMDSQAFTCYAYYLPESSGKSLRPKSNNIFGVLRGFYPTPHQICHVWAGEKGASHRYSMIRPALLRGTNAGSRHDLSPRQSWGQAEALACDLFACLSSPIEGRLPRHGGTTFVIMASPGIKRSRAHASHGW